MHPESRQRIHGILEPHRSLERAPDPPPAVRFTLADVTRAPAHDDVTTFVIADRFTLRQITTPSGLAPSLRPAATPPAARFTIASIVTPRSDTRAPARTADLEPSLAAVLPEL